MKMRNLLLLSVFIVLFCFSFSITAAWQGENTAMNYRIEENWCLNGDKRIYGLSYIPEGDGKFPLVIFSHELGNNHEAGVRYAERLAENGYAAYVFDFCGGSVSGKANRSDGSNYEMSVMTEASDLEAVLQTVKTWDYVDPGKIILLGGSQGGLVTIVAGAEHQDEIAGMILMYPALSAKDDHGVNRYAGKESVPSVVSLFGGWMQVGSNYITDIWDVDFYELLADYQGKVLLMHGDRDGTVPLSYSEKAAEILPDCEFHVIKGGGHEFFGQPFEDGMSLILKYLEEQFGGQNKNGVQGEAHEVSPDAAAQPAQQDCTRDAPLVTEQTLGENEMKKLSMKIGETPVNVEWENNESAAALKALTAEKPLTIQMSMYGGFEQVGPIGQSLPRNDVQTVTNSGDIVLYSGNQIVVFYGSNSWAYTRLGHITDKSPQEMAELLGRGDVTITIGW